MKKLFAGLVLVASLGFGALVGLSQKHETSQVKADIVESGTITVGMKPSEWDSYDRCKMAVYFFNGQTNGWSDLVLKTTGPRVVEIPYHLSFVPTKMILARFNFTKTTFDDGNNGWNDKWNQTGDLDYVANADILVGNNDLVRTSAYIMGRTTSGGEWHNLGGLSNVQINPSNDFEYFGEFTVTQNMEFKVYSNENYCDGFDKVTIDSHVDASKWQAGENSNIVYTGTSPLTVTIYYDIANGNIYIADCYEHSIDVKDASFFTNWDDYKYGAVGDPGSFKSAGDTYDCGSFNAFGPFFDGCTGGYEDKIYTLESIRWKQHTKYIYFQWGCARDSSTGDDAEKLIFNFYRNKTDSEPVASRDMYNNTFCGVTMLMKNYIIPDDIMSLFNGNDFYMNVKLYDGRGTGNYGAHTFGYLHVNQTHEEVSDAQWSYYRHCEPVGYGWHGTSASWDQYTIDQIRVHYYANDGLKAGFATGFEEQFESQESFNKNFMLDGAYDKNGHERHEDKAISFAEYRGYNTTDWTAMPFNKTGNGFFKGWYGEANEAEARGYVAHDAPIYRFVSKPFFLPENGIVSVKMGGTASLHLLQFNADHTELAFVDGKVYNTGGDENNIAASGRNVCTMVRHVINFSKYKGVLVQLAIADVSSGGWGAAYFDELKANYDEIPALKIDILPQYKGTTSYSAIKDVYVTAIDNSKTHVVEEVTVPIDSTGIDYKWDDGPTSDNSPLYNAYHFISDYFNLLRNDAAAGNASFCNEIHSDGAKALVTRFNGLSEDERNLICACDDYRRVGATSSNWSTTAPELLSMRDSLIYLAQANSMSISIASAGSNFLFAALLNDSNTTIIIVISLLSVSTLAAFFFVKKRKSERE